MLKVKEKMKPMKKTLIVSLLSTVILFSCDDPKSPGIEFMPDMYRSSAIEPYVDYNYPDSATNRLEPDNSIPRGYKPYLYEDNDEGLKQASQELTYTINLTEKRINKGKKLFGYMCAHCHGASGEGDGTIQNAIYGAVPSFLDETPNRRNNVAMKDLSAGHIYHTIMYGLNAMGPHASIVEEEERWEIIAYIQTLQGKDPIKEQKKLSEATTAVNDSL